MANFYGQYIGFSGVGSAAAASVWYGTRGIVSGGYGHPSQPHSDTMDYITIASTGNSIDFGNLTQGRRSIEALSNGTLGVSGGGTASGSPQVEVMDYVTIATIADAQDFGNLTTTRSDINGGISDFTGRGLWPGGYCAGPACNDIDYITINTLGDALDFGNMTPEGAFGASVMDGTYGLITGVSVTPMSDLIEVVTVATLSDASDFGGNIMSAGYQFGAASSDAGRGTWHGHGDPKDNRIQYVTIASAGDAQDFGDTNWTGRDGSGMMNGPRGVLTRGTWPPSVDIDYITFASTGNANDFGDLTLGRLGAGGISGS